MCVSAIYSEAFNVTAYMNTTVLGFQLMTLASGTKADILFVETSSSFLRGNYTLSISASPIDRLKTDLSISKLQKLLQMSEIELSQIAKFEPRKLNKEIAPDSSSENEVEQT